MAAVDVLLPTSWYPVSPRAPLKEPVRKRRLQLDHLDLYKLQHVLHEKWKAAQIKQAIHRLLQQWNTGRTAVSIGYKLYLKQNVITRVKRADYCHSSASGTSRYVVTEFAQRPPIYLDFSQQPVVRTDIWSLPYGYTAVQPVTLHDFLHGGVCSRPLIVQYGNGESHMKSGSPRWTEWSVDSDDSHTAVFCNDECVSDVSIDSDNSVCVTVAQEPLDGQWKAIGYKIASGCMVKLGFDESVRMSRSADEDDGKTRADSAQVLAIATIETTDDGHIRYGFGPTEVASNHDCNFVYRLGQRVTVPDFDTSDAACSAGIHFFFTQQQVLKYANRTYSSIINDTLMTYGGKGIVRDDSDIDILMKETGIDESHIVGETIVWEPPEVNDNMMPTAEPLLHIYADLRKKKHFDARFDYLDLELSPKIKKQRE